MSSGELAVYPCGIDWQATFAGTGPAARDRMIVTDKTAIKATAELFAKTNLETLKHWQ